MAERSTPIHFHDVDLTARASDCHLWVSALNQTEAPAHLLVQMAPALGRVVSLVYQNASRASDKKVAGLYVHSHGNGVGVRLEFAASNNTSAYVLTPAVR